MADSELRQAQQILTIQDVYACEVNAWADRALDPSVPLPNVAAQFRIDSENDVQIAEVSQPAPFRFLVKYYVGTGLRLLKSGVDPNRSDIQREEVLAEISATFVIRYATTTSGQPTKSMLKAFADNAIHHMWPYWREFLQSATSRFRLPAVVLPMRVIQQPSSPNQSKDVATRAAGYAQPEN
ncbi:MAG: hypothetical protein ACREVV_11980 [Steroidobacteraceae bacterium]